MLQDAEPCFDDAKKNGQLRGLVAATRAATTGRSSAGPTSAPDAPSHGSCWRFRRTASREGGSFVVVRRIRMPLDHWDTLPVAHREQRLGRRASVGPGPVASGPRGRALPTSGARGVGGLRRTRRHFGLGNTSPSISWRADAKLAPE
ncbi:Dyp-type peroxidase [Streptomyces sp. SP18ES09]|uniref:hypothetical protein n=1 Tax=Streptomyces sp. SP18ES09 TaxID=3002532 RepID=UPI002E7738D0|nr:hypothetical protein [Streptomyces sp. SP18ES09]MEE1816179.1 Dyp-type peroxidase [Streptomyces sp. SP18ES09]